MARLKAAVAFYRSLVFADNTKRTYISQLKRFTDFCTSANISLPLDKNEVCLYVAYLAETLSYKSITKYLNVVRLIHLEADLPNPLKSWHIESLLKGVKRAKGDISVQKLPITPQILLAVKSVLHLKKPADMVFWAACLVAFFGLLRKANLLPPSVSGFNNEQHLSRGNLSLCTSGFVLTIRWSKTIQFKDRLHQIALPLIPGHPLCPVSALIAVLLLNPTLPSHTPLFSFPTPCGLQLLTQSSFVTKLRDSLSHLTLPADKFSGHSFRRGGATWLLSVGMPGEYVQKIGDWKSQAYTLYISAPISTKFHLLKTCSSTLPTY